MKGSLPISLKRKLNNCSTNKKKIKHIFNIEIIILCIPIFWQTNYYYSDRFKLNFHLFQDQNGSTVGDNRSWRFLS